jgi:hypothetical protein
VRNGICIQVQVRNKAREVDLKSSVLSVGKLFSTLAIPTFDETLSYIYAFGWLHHNLIAATLIPLTNTCNFGVVLPRPCQYSQCSRSVWKTRDHHLAICASNFCSIPALYQILLPVGYAQSVRKSHFLQISTVRNC